MVTGAILRINFFHICCILVSIFCSFTLQREKDFKGEQFKHERVRLAYKEKYDYLQTLYHSKNLNISKQNIFIRAFKSEGLLELWSKPLFVDTFTLVKTYQFCKASGCLGPKRICGDKQVPEGFYTINKFNPASNYYLSLGINYPNTSDIILGNKTNTGGDIYIHGNCVSVGCIAVTDDLIKELYVVAVEAHSAGQSDIPVHIFPAKLTDSTMLHYDIRYGLDVSMLHFWKNLKEGFDYFEKHKKVPAIMVDNAGKYIISEPKIVRN